MDRNGFSEKELAVLIQESVRDGLIAALAPADSPPETDSFPPNSSGSNTNRRDGRRKSRYQGQLHLTVLPEDQEWFNVLFRDAGIQKGRLFSLLRSCFEHMEETGEIEVILTKFNIRKIRGD